MYPSHSPLHSFQHRFFPLYPLPFISRYQHHISLLQIPSPPLKANTKCNVTPPSSPYSDAILSSALQTQAYQSIYLSISRFRSVYVEWVSSFSHLFPTVYQPLLDGWDAFFFFDSFFDSRDLEERGRREVSFGVGGRRKVEEGARTL